MYNLNDIKTIHLEITSRCQASCPMCARNIQGGIENPFMSITEISKKNFIKWFPESFIKQLDRLYMCGNLGDPIIAPDTLEIFNYLRNVNSNMKLSMNTNGSAKSKKWWNELAKLDVDVNFGIDGLSDTHSLYRIGTDWNKIIENSKSFIENGGNAIWNMLVFKHNEHQITACKELSKELGFKKFITKNTSRFKDDQLIVLTRNGQTRHIIYPTSKSKNITKDLENLETIPINCKAFNEKSLYISATGNVLPCCWLDSEWYNLNHPNRIEYMDLFGQYLNLNTYSLEEIFQNNLFSSIKETWNTCSPLKECKKQCGKIDKFGEQFK